MTEFDLRALLEALHSHDISFVDSELLGVPVKVCSLRRLREMKRAQSRTQDLLDLENLPEEG